MSAELTQQEFTKHLKTSFRVSDEPEIQLELTEVKGYLSQPNEQSGMERFSIFFVGPGNRYLPQRVYSVEHAQMGTFELFLVPVGQDERGFLYEAVFNYAREKRAD